MKTMILSGLVVLGLTSTVLAQTALPDFATLDADASGGISLSEAQVSFPDLSVEAHAAADTDANGELSPKEFELAAGAVISAS